MYIHNDTKYQIYALYLALEWLKHIKIFINTAWQTEHWLFTPGNGCNTNEIISTSANIQSKRNFPLPDMQYICI